MYVDSERILETPIIEVLQYLKDNGYPNIDLDYQRRTGRNLIIRSPFREERTPSFSIMLDTNCFKDFGSGEKGGVLKVIETITGLSSKESFKFLAQIAGTEITVQNSERKPRRTTPAKNTKATVIDSVQMGFSDYSLIQYANSRGISLECLNSYCYQVSYHFRDSDFYHTNIAFPNIDGGYAFRGPGKHDKGCSTQSYTCIAKGGLYHMKPASDTTVIFEGFFDFLSYLQFLHDELIRGTLGIEDPKEARAIMHYELTTDAVVLNSVNNLDAAMGYLSQHSHIRAYLDADKAGEKCLQKLKSECKATIKDYSHYYGKDGLKDFNEYLLSRNQKFNQCLTIK